MFDSSARLRRIRKQRRADYFDYPQDYRSWVQSGRRPPLHELDDVIREFCPALLDEAES